MMKVLYLLHTTNYDGSNISLINLMTSLHEKGVTIYVVHPDSEINSTFYKKTHDMVSEYIQMEMRIWLRAHHPDEKENKFLKHVTIQDERQLWLEAIRLMRIIRRIKPDIVHTNVGVIHSGFRAAKALRIPHIWHIREYQTKDFDHEIVPSKEKFEDYLRQSYVITITKDLMNYFNLNHYEKAKCIYNGCFFEQDVAKNFCKISTHLLTVLTTVL